MFTFSWIFFFYLRICFFLLFQKFHSNFFFPEGKNQKTEKYFSSARTDSYLVANFTLAYGQCVHRTRIEWFEIVSLFCVVCVDSLKRCNRIRKRAFKWMGEQLDGCWHHKHTTGQHVPINGVLLWGNQTIKKIITKHVAFISGLWKEREKKNKNKVIICFRDWMEIRVYVRLSILAPFCNKWYKTFSLFGVDAELAATTTGTLFAHDNFPILLSNIFNEFINPKMSMSGMTSTDVFHVWSFNMFYVCSELEINYRYCIFVRFPFNSKFRYDTVSSAPYPVKNVFEEKVPNGPFRFFESFEFPEAGSSRNAQKQNKKRWMYQKTLSTLLSNTKAAEKPIDAPNIYFPLNFSFAANVWY